VAILLHSFFRISLFCMIFLCATDLASACNEPGTPNKERSTLVSSNSIKLDWNNTAPGATIYFDIESNVSRASKGNLGPYNIGMNQPFSYTYKNLTPNTRYCFRVWARTNSNGCRSKQPSAWTCTDTPDPLKGHKLAHPTRGQDSNRAVVNTIAIGAKGPVWKLGSNRVGSHDFQPYYWDGQKWVGIEGGMIDIAVVADGTPKGVNSQGQIFQRVNNRWQQLPGTAVQIAVGANGAVWILGNNHVGTHGDFQPYYWDGHKWVGIEGGLIGIAVAPDGTPKGVNSQGQIFQRVNNRWQQLPGAAATKPRSTSAGLGTGPTCPPGEIVDPVTHKCKALTIPDGFSKVDIFNCNVDVDPSGKHRPIIIYRRDVNEPTSFFDPEATLEAQYNSNGQCPYNESGTQANPETIDLVPAGWQNNHVQQIVIVDPGRETCEGRTDPTLDNCVRQTLFFRGNQTADSTQVILR